MRKQALFFAALAALVLCSNAGAANLTVVQPGLGAGTSAQCPNGCKLQVNFTGDTDKAFVVTQEPDGETVYRFDFFVHPNGLVIPDGTNIQLFIGRRDAPAARELFRVALTFRNGDYRIKAFANDDETGALQKAGQFRIGANVKSRFFFEWQAATGDNSNDGRFAITRLGTTKENTTIDNWFDGRGVDRAQFGYVRGGDAAINGPMWLDEFSSFRTLAP